MKGKISKDPIVISGISGRFPESWNVEEFWSNLLSGQVLCSDTEERWPKGYYQLPPRTGKIPGIEKFDSKFFGYTDRESHEMDPQYKLCHEVTYESVIDAGLDPVSLANYRTGVFIGCCYTDSISAQIESYTDYDSTWTELASEVSKSFGFKGPCTAYDSACASSFSAFNEAVKAINANIIDTAIISGIAICTNPNTASCFRQLGMTSNEGLSRCMDKNANGYVRSETVGTIVLQRKSVAKRIYGIILNTVSNSDGYKKEGITFPGQESMARLMTQAYQEIGLDPKDTKYIEGHVTGTQAGDPVECGAIMRVFCPEERRDPVMIGCLKSNMGHSEGASGVSAITKACLIMQKKFIPPNINFNTPNPNIPGILGGKLKPVLKVTPFHDRIISLNSFGFGGTNVHTIMQSYDEVLNENIHDITGYNGINRLILWKGRTKDSFEYLASKIKYKPKEITTEYLALIDNVSRLNSKWNLPYRGYFILDKKKNIVECDWKLIEAMKSNRIDILIDGSEKIPEWIDHHIKILKRVNLSPIIKYAEDAEINSKNGNEKKMVIKMNGNEFIITEKESSDKLLKLIGKLFMIGKNGINVNELYPPIKYPVSRTTASVSPLLTWNHEANWTVYKAPEYFRMMQRARFHFEMSGQHNYLCDHMIDGRILIPAVQYLWAVWGMLAINTGSRGASAYLISGIKFWNVKLFQAIIVSKSLEDVAITVSINFATGSFEIYHDDACIVTGSACLTYDSNVPSAEGYDQLHYASELEEETKSMISKKDFYKELRVRGYDYKECFQGVDSCKMDGTIGYVSFLYNWVCFMDAVLQLMLINSSSRDLLLPTGFDFIQVDAKVFKPITKTESNMYKTITESSAVEKADGGGFDDEEGGANGKVGGENENKGGVNEDQVPVFKVLLVKETLEVFTHGVYIKGMHATLAPRKKATPVIRENGFIPFDQECNENLIEKIDYVNNCLRLIHGSQDGSFNSSNDISSDNTSKKSLALMDAIKKLKEDGKMISKNSISDFDISSDMLTMFPLDHRFMFHQFGVVTDYHTMKELNIIEVNISTISSIEDEMKSCLERIMRNQSFGINYSVYSIPKRDGINSMDEVVEKSKPNPIEQYLGMEKISSDMILILHPSLGFTFLESQNSMLNKLKSFDQVVSNTLNKAKNDTFIIILARIDTNIIEKELNDEENIHILPKSIANISLRLESSNMTIFSTKKIGSYVSIFGKRCKSVSSENKVSKMESNGLGVSKMELSSIRIPDIDIFNIPDSFNYDWIEELKQKLLMNKSNGEENDFWITSMNGQITGLPGFINCILNEEKRIHGLVFMDENCLDQDMIMNRACAIDLPLIACKNGLLGSITNSQDLNHTNCSEGKYADEKNTNEIITNEKIISEELKSNQMKKMNESSTIISYCLDVESKGDLSSLAYQKIRMKKSDTICDIHYAALNFRDIMVATGRVSMNAYPNGLLPPTNGIIGMELSGIDSNGNRIMALVPSDSIATKIDVGTGNDWLFNVPDWMNLEEAATIPAVYSTAYYALIMRGKLIPGESVLIHAGSGGVGQAAINICLSMGCEVFTTVGTKEKRQFIRKRFPTIDEDHIFDSRSISFRDNLLIATNGRGVNVILNSLSEEKLQAGLTCLADSGRFIEIGKYDFLVDSPMDPSLLTRNQSFESVCLAYLMAKLLESERGMMSEMKILRSLMEDGLKRGVVKPLSRHVFAWNQAEEAFRFMANGKHIGKVLIKMNPSVGEDSNELISVSNQISNQESNEVSKSHHISKVVTNQVSNPVMATKERIIFDGIKSYIVIGGLGGMGLEICYWLVLRGVRNLIITSRTGIRTAYHEFCINRMEKFGACVMVRTEDASDFDQAVTLINCACSLGPVGGIFNLAMVLKDGLFEDQTKESFEECCRIKVHATANLDRITRSGACPDLDHFVCFSSLVSTIGNVGQTNYGFANSFIDDLCARRKADGLPGLALGWGAIGDVGHVAERIGHDVTVAGSMPQRINSTIDILERYLYQNHPVIGSYVPMDQKSGLDIKGNLVGTILNVLGVKDHSKVDHKATLGDLGLDSLMAVEIRQVLEKKFDTIMSTKEVRELTIGSLRNMESNNDNIKNVDVKNIDKKHDQMIDLINMDDMKLPNEIFSFIHNSNLIKKGVEPIFLFPPIGNSFIDMEKMLVKLSTLIQRPFIGVYWTIENDSHENIQQLASFYLLKLENEYSHVSSYDIIAYSFGTLISLEMAYQIQRNGKNKSIRNLCLLDYSPTYGKLNTTGRVNNNDGIKTWQNIVFDHISSKIEKGSFDWNQPITAIPNDESFSNVYNRIKIVMKSKYSDADYIKYMNRIWKKVRMIHDYDPKEILHHDILLIRASGGLTHEYEQSIPFDYELSNIVSGRIHVINLDGNHQTFLNINHERIANEIMKYIST